MEYLGAPSTELDRSTPRLRTLSRGPSRSNSQVRVPPAQVCGAQSTDSVARSSHPQFSLVSDVQHQFSLESGSHTQQGKKPGNPGWTNQDCYLEIHLNDGKFLAAVFDGHGSQGRLISHRIKDLFASMAHVIAAAVDTHTAFKQAFAICQAQLEIEGHCDDSGATATVALFDSRQEAVSLAHVGDSTALLTSPDGSIAFQTRDHKPDAPSELPRLQAHGAVIVNGRLCFDSINFALARSMGDLRSQRYGVIAEPEIVCGLPLKAGCSLTLASDGVWDMISKDVVASIVAHARPQEAVQLLVNSAHSLWSAKNYVDDITALTVKAPDTAVHPPVLLGRHQDENSHAKVSSINFKIG